MSAAKKHQSIFEGNVWVSSANQVKVITLQIIHYLLEADVLLVNEWFLLERATASSWWLVEEDGDLTICWRPPPPPNPRPPPLSGAEFDISDAGVMDKRGGAFLLSTEMGKHWIMFVFSMKFLLLFVAVLLPFSFRCVCTASLRLGFPPAICDWFEACWPPPPWIPTVAEWLLKYS